jgi:signal transduction histidine kinase
MNKKIFLFFPFFIFISICGFASENLTFKVGVYENRPKIFTDAEGKASGFWPEILDYIAENEDWTLEYIPGIWEECLQRLESGEIDIMPDVAYTEEREELFEFSNRKVYTSWSRIYVKKDDTIYDILDLENKKIAVLKNSVNVEGLDGIKNLVKAFNINCFFIEVESYDEVFKMVNEGKADAAVASKDFAIRNIDNYNLINTPIIFQPSTLYFAFPKNSELTAYLRNRIDHHLKEIEENEDSVYYQSLEKWFVSPENEIFPAWLIWIFVVSLGAILVLGGGSFLLRAKVRARTKALREEILKHMETEKELQKHKNHLEEMVSIRTTELTRSNKELERFAYITSHDLQEPLRMISSYLQLVEKRYKDELDADAKDFIDFAVDGAKRMQILINDLLRYSRVGTKNIEFQPVNCEEILKNTLNNLEVAIEESGAKITHDYLPEIKGDKTQLSQLFQNLIGNSIKFRGESSPEIHIKVEDENDFWKFSFQDNGIGIDPKYFDRIFQVFQRLHNRDEYPGTGIGLAICKKIIERHGGDIFVESEYGKGTTFIFTLRKEAHDESQ